MKSATQKTVVALFWCYYFNSTLIIHARKYLKKGVLILGTKGTKTPFDKHHILYIREEWKKGKLNKLRLHPYCVISLDRDSIHRYLHVHLACIPAPSGAVVDPILAQLEILKEYGAISQEDSLEKRLTILIALFECIAQPTADALKEQLRLAREFYIKKAPP